LEFDSDLRGEKISKGINLPGGIHCVNLATAGVNSGNFGAGKQSQVDFLLCSSSAKKLKA
jgi:hypothetical protein